MSFLHQIGASPETLHPPRVGDIPTPFAATLPRAEGDEVDGAVELGLYGQRVQARVLKGMVRSLEALTRERGHDAGGALVDGETDQDGMGVGKLASEPP